MYVTRDENNGSNRFTSSDNPHTKIIRLKIYLSKIKSRQYFHAFDFITDNCAVTVRGVFLFKVKSALMGWNLRCNICALKYPRSYKRNID